MWGLPLDETSNFGDNERYLTVIPAKSWYTVTTPQQSSWWVLVRMDLEGWAK